MPVALPDAPEAPLELVRRYAPMLLRAMGHALDELQRLTVARPYPLYTLPAAAVMGEHPLQIARQSAWEYLILDGDSVIGLAEVEMRDAHGNENIAFATLHPRGYADAIATRIAEAERLPETAGQKYELRILRAPSLTALAIWLSGEHDDLLLPIDGRDATWKDVERVASEADLVRTLRPIAQERETASDS